LFGFSFLLFSVFLGVTAARITRDISSVSQLVSSLYHDSHHDPLTGLPNRAAVLETLDRLLSAAHEGTGSLALLYIDLDGFKAVNDRPGPY
jgi:GGDEF domain-containing protein